jgi:hypothetical protein
VPKAGSDVRRTQGKGYQVRPPHANPCWKALTTLQAGVPTSPLAVPSNKPVAVQTGADISSISCPETTRSNSQQPVTSFPSSIEHEVSVVCSQEPYTWPCLQQNIIFFWDPFYELCFSLICAQIS